MSKATNENYIIRIKSYIDQFDSEGNIKEEDRDHIELMTRGNLVKKGESFYITYKETQTIGFEGCTTTIKIAEDGSRVALLRFGRANSQLLIERERRNLCHYETEVGSLTLGVTGDGIDCNLTEKGGSAVLPAGRRRRPPCQPQHAGNDRTTCELTSQALTRQLSCQESPWHVGPVLLFRLRLPNHVGPAFKRKGHLTND